MALTADGAAITNQPLCHACVNLLQERYDELPEILRVLPAWKGGMRGESGEAKVSKSKGEPPLPINVGVLDVIDMIREILEDIGSLRISDLARHENCVGRPTGSFESPGHGRGDSHPVRSAVRDR